MTKKSKKNKKPRPQPKPNRQIPNSLVKKISLLGPRQILQNARQYPLHGCWIMSGWQDSGITPVVVARKQSENLILFAVYMVDTYCLGVKDAYAHTDVSLAKFERQLPMMCAEKPEQISPELAHEVVYGGLEYAERYGFQPGPDFTGQLADMVLDPPDVHPRSGDVVFGKDGKPFYVSGPNESAWASNNIVNTLTRTAGEGNFEYLIGIDDGLDLLEDDEEEWEDDDLDQDDEDDFDGIDIEEVKPS